MKDDRLISLNAAIETVRKAKSIGQAHRMLVQLPSATDTNVGGNLIDRQAALDALGEEPPVWYDGEDEIAERNQWRRDVAAIKALPSAQPGWIPCSERMPEEDGQYLITVKYKHVNDSYEDIYAEHGEFYDGRWDMFCFGHCGEVEDILAWCELPEPWEEEKAEGAATPRGVIFGIGGHPNGQKRIDGGKPL